MNHTYEPEGLPPGGYSLGPCVMQTGSPLKLWTPDNPAFVARAEGLKVISSPFDLTYPHLACALTNGSHVLCCCFMGVN